MFPINHQKTQNDRLLVAVTETKNQVKSAFLVNVVVGLGAGILKLLTSEDETMLVKGDAFLVLNLRIFLISGIRRSIGYEMTLRL